MRYKFGIFTAVVWQPALPETPIRTEISGNAVRVYVTGRGLPDWMFDDVYERKDRTNIVPLLQGNSEELSWQGAAMTGLSAVANTDVSTADEQRKDISISIKSKMLAEYAAMNNFTVVDNYMDLAIAIKRGGSDFEEILRFLWCNSHVQTLLVEMVDRSYFSLKDWITLGGLGLDIHFVMKTEILSDDSCAAERHLRHIEGLMKKEAYR